MSNLSAARKFLKEFRASHSIVLKPRPAKNPAGRLADLETQEHLTNKGRVLYPGYSYEEKCLMDEERIASLR